LLVQLTNSAAGTFIFKRPMLNLGSIPAPYEKKHGERMVMPVVKKNLFNGTFDMGYLILNTNDLYAPSQGQRATKWIACKPNTFYVVNGGDRQTWQFRDGSGNRIIGVDAQVAKTPSNAAFMRVYYSSNGSHANVQIEEGAIATPYEPYTVQMNEKPKKPITPASKGLIMDGVSNYLQLPSMTMDSVEIDCMLTGGDSMVLDTRNGFPNGWVSKIGKGTNNLKTFVNGIETSVLSNDQRIKLLVTFSNSFTDDINIFSSSGGGTRTQGILYGVKCYLNGQVVADYDFTKENTKAKNVALGNPMWNLKGPKRILEAKR
jgi:hypothetical protein